MQNTNGQQKISPKLQQFIEELNALQDKYQFSINPVLQISPNGVVPGIKIVDKIPPKDPVPAKTDVPVVPEKPIMEKPAEEKLPATEPVKEATK